MLLEAFIPGLKSPKNEREAPGFRHGEERGCDFSRLQSKCIAIAIFLVNWFAILVANACYSSSLGSNIETARSTTENPTDIGADFLACGDSGSNNIACLKAFVTLHP